MKFQDDISNMNMYIHTDKLKPICPPLFQSWGHNKRGTHLADTFDIFKSDFNILCTVGFPQPDISARSRTICLLSLLMADSTFDTLQVLRSGGLPIRSAAVYFLAKSRN